MIIIFIVNINLCRGAVGELRLLAGYRTAWRYNNDDNNENENNNEILII